MLRALLVAVALVGLACGRDQGSVTPTAPTGGAYSTVTPAGDFNGGNGAPQSDHVAATVIITRFHSKSRECEGQDGHYFEDHGVFYGTSTGDPRLSGDFQMRLILDLFNVTNGGGPQYGDVVIRDPVSGRKKAQGVSSAWGVGLVKGTIVGDVSDEGAGGEDTSGDGKLVAGFEFTILPDGRFAIQIGGVSGDNTMPAGIWSGRCHGKFTEQDFDFTSAGAALGAASIPGKSWRRGSR